MRYGWLLLGAAVLSFAAAASDPTRFGFPVPAASLVIAPGESAELRLGEASLLIPKGAFGNRTVRLELYTGFPDQWQPRLAKDQQVLYAFALKASELGTNQPVETFARPLRFTYFSPKLGQGASFFDVPFTPETKAVPDPVPAQIRFVGGGKLRMGVLSHGVSGTQGGWLVVLPTKS